jgi:tetratricopeptide (TPR) repeat protein
LIFFPHDLHYYRSQDILLPFFRPLMIMLAGFVAVAAGIGCMPAHRKKMMVFGLAWFFLSMGPTLNIVPLINEYSQVLTAEHFLYFPIIGILIVVLEAAHFWMTRKNEQHRTAIGRALLMALVVFSIGMVIRQNAYWRGEIPLFERTLKYEKNFGRAHFSLAQAYATAGRFEEAIVEGRRALAIMEGYYSKVSKKEVRKFYLHFIEGIRYHLGFCLDAVGDRPGALAEFREVLRLNPENKIIDYTLGLSYLKGGDLPNATAHFEKALARNPNDLVVMNSLAICYQESGEDPKAEQLLRTIAERDRGSASAQENLKRFLEKRAARDLETMVPKGEGI